MKKSNARIAIFPEESTNYYNRILHPNERRAADRSVHITFPIHPKEGGARKNFTCCLWASVERGRIIAYVEQQEPPTVAVHSIKFS